MLNLEGVVKRIDDECYQDLSEKLVANKADKYHSLLKFYREDNHTEKEMHEILGVNSNAFYVLKSRLFDRVQEYLLENVEDPKAAILNKIISIPTLIYNSQPEIAIAILTKLEKDLLSLDMPYELTSVYKALKKLNIHTEKYYEYAQLYNKNVAYTLSLDKAEDLLSDFVAKIGKYKTSREDVLLDSFPLIKKEINHLNSMYDSHHLKVIKNIIDISIDLFLPLKDLTKNDEPVEDVLNETRSIMDKYPNDLKYQHFEVIVDYLQFEYYHSLGLVKKEKISFDRVNMKLPSFLNYNHSIYTHQFLFSKVDRYISLDIPENLMIENNLLTANFSPNINDVSNYIEFKKYLAISAYLSNNNDAAIKELSSLINEVSFKNNIHAEIEIKLFISLLYCFKGKHDLAWNIIRSATRKIRERNDDLHYDHAIHFSKMLKIVIGTLKSNSEEKALQQLNKFRMLNQGKYKMLQFLRLEDSIVSEIINS